MSEDIEHRFGYHPPLSKKRVHDHEMVRHLCMDVAKDFDGRLPDGREKSLAVTKLEEAMFWANAALARAYDPNAEVSEAEAVAGPRELSS